VKVRALARGLAHHGYEVTVLTANLGFTESNGFGLRVEPCQWGWRTQEEGVEAIYLSTLGHYRALTFNPRVVGFCRASLRRFDLVHFYGLYDLLGPAVSYFCRRRAIPYVIEPMGMYRPIDRSFQLKRLWHRSFGEIFWRGASQIIATSEMEQKELLEDGVPAEKLIVRFNGIDSDADAPRPARGSFRAKWDLRADQPLILFLGRLIPRKGADILIRAFAQACPDSGYLVIAGPEGEPGFRAQLEKCGSEVGVAARVLFTGPLYDEEKKAVLADADVFALPSRYENFANAAAEAMACGIPVVVTEHCGISSLVDGKAGLVIAPEKEALAAAIRRLIDDNSLYEKFQAGCREVAGQLSWDRLTTEMAGHYEKVCAGTNGNH